MGKASVFFVGTGSAFAMKHFQTSIIIEKDGQKILVDCGENGPMALHHHKIKTSEISDVFITHLHSDHVGGLPHLALKNYYVDRRPWGGNHPRLKCIVTEHMQQLLWDTSIRGALAYNEVIVDDTHATMRSERPMDLSDYFTVVRPQWKQAQPREVWEADVNGIHLEIFRTVHIPEQAATWQAAFPSYGLMIDGEIFYSGDTQFDPELIEMYGHAKIFFHDVQFFTGAVHASLEELRTLPADIKERMFLMHYADNYDEQDITGFAGWAKQGAFYSADWNFQARSSLES